MTENEVETQEEQHANEEDIDYDKLRTNWGMNVTKSTVRLKIWQILQLFGEMNVTQISNLLKESKSTVSRHLVGMVEDRLLESHEDKSCCEGRIPPKNFRIHKEIMEKGSMQEIDFPDEINEQINFIKAEIQTNRSSIEMITGIMNLLLPLYNEVETLIKNGDEESKVKAIEIFKKYMWKNEKANNVTWFMFKYTTEASHSFGKKMEQFTWNLLKDDFDIEKFKEERSKLKAEHDAIMETEKNNDVKKKYGHFCIDMPLRAIFKKNLPDKKSA